MRILEIIPLGDTTGAFGGPTSVALEQAKALRLRGHEVLVTGGWAEPAEPPTEMQQTPCQLFRAHRAAPGGRFTGYVSLPMWRWMRRRIETFDVVHIHTGRHLMPALIARMAHRRGIPVFVQPHGMLPPSARYLVRLFDALIMRTVIRRSHVCCLTEREKEELQRQYGLGLKFSMLFNAVAPGPDLDAGSSVSPKTPEVLYVGRLAPRKRLPDLLAAARALMAAGTHFTVAIAGPDEGQAAALTQAIGEQGLSAIARIEGPLAREAVRSRMAKASIFVLPSVDEPFPMAVLEALSVGVPVVVTTGCEIATLLEESGAATVCVPGSTGLTSAIGELLASAELRHSRSINGRALLETQLSSASLATRLEALYRAATHYESTKVGNARVH